MNTVNNAEKYIKFRWSLDGARPGGIWTSFDTLVEVGSIFNPTSFNRV